MGARVPRWVVRPAGLTDPRVGRTATSSVDTRVPERAVDPRTCNGSPLDPETTVSDVPVQLIIGATGATGSATARRLVAARGDLAVGRGVRAGGLMRGRRLGVEVPG